MKLILRLIFLPLEVAQVGAVKVPTAVHLLLVEHICKDRLAGVQTANAPRRQMVALTLCSLLDLTVQLVQLHHPHQVVLVLGIGNVLVVLAQLLLHAKLMELLLT